MIVPSVFMTETGIGLAALGLIFYMRDVHGLTEGAVGWFAAVWLMSYLLGCLFMRPIMGRIHPRLSVILSVSCMAFFIFSILQSPSIVLSFVLYAFYGLAMSFFWPPLMGWLSSGMEGSDLGAAMSKLTLAGSLGMIISPFMAGLLSEQDPVIPAYAAIGLFCATAILGLAARLLAPDTRIGAIPKKVEKRTEPQSDNSTPLRYPAWIGLFGTCVVLGVVANIFPMYARTELGINKSTVGFILLIRALGAAAGYVVLGRTKFWHFQPLPMIAGLTTLLLLVLTLPWLRSAHLLTCLVALLGLFHSVAFSYSFFHGASGSSRREQRMAIHESLLSGGIITGSTVGGMLYQHRSMLTVCLFAAVVLLLIIAGQTVLFVRFSQQKMPGVPKR